ncbi:MAG: hypothetical protein CMO81_09520 [Waddliaceae bacterium]|nr:hypothetical protein [Waddliaceae bacterium]
MSVCAVNAQESSFLEKSLERIQEYSTKIEALRFEHKDLASTVSLRASLPSLSTAIIGLSLLVFSEKHRLSASCLLISGCSTLAIKNLWGLRKSYGKALELSEAVQKQDECIAGEILESSAYLQYRREKTLSNFHRASSYWPELHEEDWPDAEVLLRAWALRDTWQNKEFEGDLFQFLRDLRRILSFIERLSKQKRHKDALDVFLAQALPLNRSIQQELNKIEKRVDINPNGLVLKCRVTEKLLPYLVQMDPQL